MRVGWNRVDPNLLATFALHSNEVRLWLPFNLTILMLVLRQFTILGFAQCRLYCCGMSQIVDLHVGSARTIYDIHACVN